MRLARDLGALRLLPNARIHLAVVNVHSGDFATAAAQIAEVDALAEATGLPPLKYATGMLAAVLGDLGRMQAIADVALPSALARGEGSAVGGYWLFMARLHNGLGHYDEALATAQRACEHEDVVMYGWAVAERVEAAVRADQPGEATRRWSA